MSETNVFKFSQPGRLSDPLTEVLRGGARALLAQAVEAKVAAFLGSHADSLTDLQPAEADFRSAKAEDGRRRLVRRSRQATASRLTPTFTKIRQ